MGGQGDCCVAPYAADNSYDRIMLRFRPIAPKPAPSTTACDSSSGGSSPGSNKGSRETWTTGGRRFVRNNTTTSEKKKKKKKKKKKITRGLSSTAEEEIKGTMTSDRVTLPLLPPPDENKGNYGSGVVCGDVTTEGKPNFILSGAGNYDLAPGFGKTPGPITKQPFDSCRGSWGFRGGDSEGGIVVLVVVECVTDAWVDGRESEMGLTDEGRVKSLRENTCPSFISDGEGRVRWLNKAFRRMMVAMATTGGGGGDKGVEGVWLRMREGGWMGRSFSCRVRMVCTWRGMKMGSSMTSPCDVWRMDGGDFAWRLDVGAALRLGL